ncbi:MAG: winged helix-turn-helix transcriptional regulator [Candidatus Desulfofervidus auxilii]|nr:winged helix-turn-helix transcriptional regulator [Candidatus Desulfofervidus auxilii]
MEEKKQKIIDFLKSIGGKGVATQAEIAKGTGIDRRIVMKLIKELEKEGKVTSGGRAAGVGGYKLVDS